ncbi:hypothetical protein HRbin35_00339 [bacterium HR35]|nr:hypothetical protein HRbin35_00339 [bacterium HR35]
MSEESKKEEFKYTFIGPGSLIGKEEDEKKEMTEFKSVSFSKEEIPINEQVIASSPPLEEKTEIKEGKLTLQTPPERIEELKLEEEKKESFQPPNLSEITFKREERFTRPRKELLEEAAANLPEEKSRKIDFSRYLLYLIPALVFFVLIFLIIYFKPYQEIVKLFQTKKEPTPPPPEEPIILPKAEEKQSETSTEEKRVETISLPIEKQKTENQILNQPLTPSQPTSQIKLFPFLPQYQIKLTNPTEGEIQKALEEFNSRYQLPNNFLVLNLNYQNQKLPIDLLLNYFFKDKNFQEKIKPNLSTNYEILVYQSLSRKYLVLVFEINNFQEIEKLNLAWEKTFSLEKIKNFYFDFKPTKVLSKNFISESYDKIKYRVIFLDNNNVFAWFIFKNYLVYLTSEKTIPQLNNLLR